MESDLLELAIDIGEHHVVATLTAPPAGNRRLAVLLIARPSAWSMSIAEQRAFAVWKEAALAWAISLNGAVPLVVEPQPGSGPTRPRRTSGEHP